MEKIVEVTEICPHCEAENTMVWDVKRDGYEAFCSHCGKKMMLCDECLHADDNKGCDWRNGTCFRCDNNTCNVMELFEDEAQLLLAEDCFDIAMNRVKAQFGETPPACYHNKLWDYIVRLVAIDLKPCCEKDVKNTIKNIQFFAFEEMCENCNC